MQITQNLPRNTNKTSTCSQHHSPGLAAGHGGVNESTFISLCSQGHTVESCAVGVMVNMDTFRATCSQHHSPEVAAGHGDVNESTFSPKFISL